MWKMWIQLLCACVLYSYGSRGQTQWVVTSISHMGEMRDSDWSRPNLLRSDWLPIHVAPMTTSSDFLVSEPMTINIQNRQHIRLFSPFNSVRAAFLKSCLCFLCLYGACVCCHPNLHFSVSVFVTFSWFLSRPFLIILTHSMNTEASTLSLPRNLT